MGRIHGCILCILYAGSWVSFWLHCNGICVVFLRFGDFSVNCIRFVYISRMMLCQFMDAECSTDILAGQSRNSFVSPRKEKNPFSLTVFSHRFPCACSVTSFRRWDKVRVNELGMVGCVGADSSKEIPFTFLFFLFLFTDQVFIFDAGGVGCFVGSLICMFFFMNSRFPWCNVYSWKAVIFFLFL